MLFSYLFLTVSVAVFVLTSAQILLQVWFAFFRKITPTRRSLDHTPFVSIHIAVHNKPQELLKSTLRALRQLDYPYFEVLVRLSFSA